CPVQSVTHVTGSYSRRSLNNPGSRQQKSPLRGTSDYCYWLFGYGSTRHPCLVSPQPASLLAAPAIRNNLRRF
ncbi:hypothetical protein, partial [Pluralibacter gergoviae]|uniref:hypothetical protein n=1 Tax=Pluralibacter gergoviae TaxID=61647 RepID=UPI002FDB7BB5